VRIDQRTLKEQGIDRKPQIHVGPAAMKAAANGRELESRDVVRGNGRTTFYTVFDQGTRLDYNTRIIERNEERARRAARSAESSLDTSAGREPLPAFAAPEPARAAAAELQAQAAEHAAGQQRDGAGMSNRGDLALVQMIGELSRQRERHHEQER
jgi:hypothetical protein